jgi:hypothetical protein
MPSTRTKTLFVLAALLSGLLAGGVVDRVLVGGPAWSELGAEAWVEYSRRADLGTGLIVYPIEGIGSTLLIFAAALSSYFDRGIGRGVRLPLYCALALSAAGLLLTAKAAPIMLSLGAPQNAVAAQRAFDEFFVWGLYLRGAVDTLAFAALLWALSNVAWRAK